MGLTKEQIAKYNSDGYLVVKSVFTLEESRELKAELLAEIEAGKAQLNEERARGAPTEMRREKIGDVPRAIEKGMLQDVAHRNPKFMKLAKNSKLTGLVTPFLGNSLSMYRSLSVFRPKGFEGEVGWHQDMPYWTGTNKKISLWLSLDKVDAATGAMKMIPGSHHQVIQDLEKQNEVFSLTIPGQYIDSSMAVSAETEIGDVVLFDSQVIHSSGPNETGRDRYTLIFTFQPSSDYSHHREGRPEIVAEL